MVTRANRLDGSVSLMPALVVPVWGRRDRPDLDKKGFL